MGNGNEGLLNAISIFFLGATGIAVIIFIMMFFAGGQVAPDIVLATSASFPTVTQTPIPPTATNTRPPTNTPTIPPTDTPIPSPTTRPTGTGTATPLPSATITPTESVTPTLDVTLTFTPIPTPTGPTPTPPPPYPFAGPAEIQFTSNFTNQQGCAWQGIGGQVRALGGGEFTNPLQVHVFNNFQDFGRTFTGSAGAYGASGFEVRVANSITRDMYFIQLESRNGVAISPQVQVEFPGDCEQNVALVNFEQVRSLNP